MWASAMPENNVRQCEAGDSTILDQQACLNI